MSVEYRYAGPDGERIADLREGAGAAVGSEYCVHLVPGPDGMSGAVAAARERRIPLLLLTPYFRDAELKAAMPVFRSIPAGADVEVAVNDWGALSVLRTLFPHLRLSCGRLLSGQKRCPRIGGSAVLAPRGRAWHGEGAYASARTRAYLETVYGITGYHVDALPWAPDLAGLPAEGTDGGSPRLFVHAPYAIVTVTDRCPWIGGKSSASVSSCPRPCRKGTVLLREPSMGGEMVQRGKARFVSFVPPGCGIPGPQRSRDRVVYGDPP